MPWSSYCKNNFIIQITHTCTVVFRLLEFCYSGHWIPKTPFQLQAFNWCPGYHSINITQWNRRHKRWNILYASHFVWNIHYWISHIYCFLEEEARHEKMLSTSRLENFNYIQLCLNRSPLGILGRFPLTVASPEHRRQTRQRLITLPLS